MAHKFHSQYSTHDQYATHYSAIGMRPKPRYENDVKNRFNSAMRRVARHRHAEHKAMKINGAAALRRTRAVTSNDALYHYVRLAAND
jgi:hypothetical protein